MLGDLIEMIGALLTGAAIVGLYIGGGVASFWALLALVAGIRALARRAGKAMDDA